MSDAAYHATVLQEEVIKALAPQPGETFIDATLGHGGHTILFAQLLGCEGFVVGIDRDPSMLESARLRIEADQSTSARCLLLRADHADLVQAAAQALAEAPAAPSRPDSILFDLGPSTPQLRDPARGMSWNSELSLNMKMNPEAPGPTAEEIVNEWDERRLRDLFKNNADERWAARIAEKIVERRKTERIKTGKELGDVVKGAIPKSAWPPSIHPATRVFLALRIEVNGEYATLEKILPEAFEFLKPGGRLGVITFHGGEAQRVKEFMRKAALPPPTPWPLPQSKEPAHAEWIEKGTGPGREEMQRNPHSRSARLWAIRKRA